MMILLRYVSFVLTLEMSLSNCVCSESHAKLVLKYVRCSKFLEAQLTTFTIIDPNFMLHLYM